MIEAISEIKNEIESGYQVYVICPRIDELDEDGMIPTEVVYGLLATILMSINEEDHEGDEH